MKSILPIFEALRPKQWTKNLVVFAALIFSERALIFKPLAWEYALLAFVIFCGLSGSVYLLNDLTDIEKDRLHPEKRLRPIASGQLGVNAARGTLFLLLGICLSTGWWIFPPLFWGSAVAFFLINIAYSFWLKNIVILDVLTIAIGFVLRAQAGVGAMQTVDPRVGMSHWLILCTLMLALFLGLVKRRQEIMRFGDDASGHRKILEEYSPHFVDEMTGVVAATTLIGYSLYTVAPETIARIGSNRLIYTVPFVVYGIFRYQYLIHMRQQGENPSAILLTDLPLQINLALWILAVVLLIHVL